MPNGINPHTTNEECRTPFPWIVEQDTGPPDVAEGCGSVVDILLERDRMNHDSADESGRGPLSWAAENGHDNIVGVLLQQNDTSPNTADESGRTPYPSPTRNGYRRVVSGQAVSRNLLFISGLEEELSLPFATDPFPLPELLLKNICRLSYIYYTTDHKLPPSFTHATLSAVDCWSPARATLDMLPHFHN